MATEARETYLFSQPPNETSSLWSFLLDFFRPLTFEALVDAYPAPVWGEGFAQLPESARRAHEILARLGNSQRQGRDLLMAVRVVPDDESAWEALRDFGPHSIHVELHPDEEEGEAILVNHDSGGIYARLKEQELASLVVQAGKIGVPIEMEKVQPQARSWRFWRRPRQRSQQ